MKTYQAGTLNYTARGLAFLFFWLLWGDFAFTFFESIFGRFLPFYLKDLNASNTLISVMTGSIAGAVNILFLPNFSRWSDQYRSRLGRRIPFLYVVAPVTALSLVGVGFAPEIAAWIHLHFLSRVAPSVAVGTIIIGLLCFLVVSYHFFNMMLVNLYNWLLRDVVPQETISRFLAWFRVVGALSSMVFLWYVFPHLMERRREVFIGVALFYLAAFLLMCFWVKEGEYPPPPAVDERPGMVEAFLLYFRDCMSVPIYRNFFIAYLLASIATNCAGPFGALFTRDTLHITMHDMGKLFTWGTAAGPIAFVIIGWFCDRFSPLRVTLVGFFGMAIGCVAGYFLVQGKTSYLVFSLVNALPSAAWGIGSFAATMKLFPSERFGQLSSGLNVFGCGALIVGNFLMGRFMDLVHSNYRMTYVWSAVLFTLAAYPMWLVIRDWKRYGGPDHYVAPLPPVV
ncbi:MFS-type transporter involved in bile tolerance, Atg22 family [Verrucomicrobium sp. GAS474]|uniref:MFS transporter n=1 Tax=Verrucomicrobium sp. GAS474 TaxID=1882831 RepID=UPI00087B9F14|nr:MFS transporter [Verrucomicrobium sp. GAS474]SDU05523.1 MFS-type transporter involved in bile tolerance, Atg22 family [Verrucomicrobium sp. GAS474]